MRLPNGYGSVVNLGKKRRKPFAARVTTGFDIVGYHENGAPKTRQKYKYLGYFTKRTEALACLLAYNNSPYDLTKHNITFSQIYEEWAERKYEKISEATKINYKMAYNKCQPLYNKPFKDLKTKDLQKIIDANAELTGVVLIKYLFNQLWKYGIKHDLIEKNYADFIELPAKKESAPKVPYTTEEINHLWHNLHIPNVDILLILLYTGLRVMELLELKTENIHLDKRYFFVAKSKSKAGIRNVPIHKKIAPLIEARYNKGYDLLIPNSKGNVYRYNSFLTTQYEELKKALNIDHTLHETRHTFVSQCNRLELNEVSVQRIIGHRNKNITQHYTAKDMADLIKVIDNFNY